MMPAKTPDIGSTDALLIHAYVDGELDVAAAIKVKGQIEADAGLGAEVERIVALKQALREKLHTETVSPNFKARIELAAGISRRRNAPSWRAMAASVTLAAVVSSASTWLAFDSLSNGVLEQVVDSHTRAMITARPTDVSSSDQHVVKPWFNDKLTTAPTVIDLRNDGYPLAGARIDVIAARPVATLVYNRRLHSISLFERPDDGPTASPSVHRPIQGLNVISWKQEDTEYWAVSDLNAKELAEFSELLRKANRR